MRVHQKKALHRLQAVLLCKADDRTARADDAVGFQLLQESHAGRVFAESFGEIEVNKRCFLLFMFWTVGGLRFCTYGEILSLRVFYGTLTEYAIVLIVLELFKVNPCSPIVFAAVLFVALLMVLFGSNQAGIDFMMQRRHHRFDLLPPKIRSYNIRLFAVSAGILLVLLLLYRPIAWLLGLAGSGLYATIRWLLSLLLKGQSGEQSESAESQPTQSPQNMSQVFGKGETSPFWTYFGIALAIGGVYLLYYYRHEIHMGLRSAWRAIREFVERLLFGGRQKADRDETEYYTETDQKIETDDRDFLQEASVADRRKWRRACRRFAAEPDSSQALRRGYRLILQGIELQGVPVAVSDTTLEICGSALQKGLPPLEACTRDYNLLRYGEHEFDLNSMTDLRTALAKLLHYRKADR